MARAEHGNPRPARGLRKLVTESVALGDRLSQLFLVDLVVRHGHRLPREKGSGSAHPFLGPSAGRSGRAHSSNGYAHAPRGNRSTDRSSSSGRFDVAITPPSKTSSIGS